MSPICGFHPIRRNVEDRGVRYKIGGIGTGPGLQNEIPGRINNAEGVCRSDVNIAGGDAQRHGFDLKIAGVKRNVAEVNGRSKVSSA
jgi:hypothetical protein